ncbi:helix-turn-helix domain-containing protein [Flavobacterium sp. j3]|uniref:Helix-turn-helix domain-containing protein n=1 Tax=Flavobacterium aureirubrum TaxID=3133147 RepID=A0ABU9N6D4_9FLAO
MLQEKLIIHLKNLYTKSGIKLLELVFNNIDGVTVNYILLGEVSLFYDKTKLTSQYIYKKIEDLEFVIVKDENLILVEKIKIACIELIYMANNVDSLIKKSNYISEKLGLPYNKISKIFSDFQPYTLENYIILLKIECVKHMIRRNEYNLSEISYMMNYSSVHYLSNQFKKITGYTVSDFKNNKDLKIKPLEDI